MKQIIPFLILCLSSAICTAQNKEQTVTLNEVSVQGARVINTTDGQTIYPTPAQKESSPNGYSLLQKLSLANIRIDGIAHTISAADNRGEVQVRINNVIVSKQEMLSLDAKTVSKIEFIDNPGVRYGDDIAYVVNIITRRNDSGYTIGTDATATLTALNGHATAYGKWNSGKGELTVSYSLGGHKLKGDKTSSVTDYILTDGSVRTIMRNDVETMARSGSHDMKLTYNLTDSTVRVFQVSLSESLASSPDNYSFREILDGKDSYTSTNRKSSHTGSPVVDVYFFRQISPRQSVTANVVGTYITTTSSDFYDEHIPYQYDVDGRSASVLSEAIYENKLTPFTLSAGLNHRYKHTRNSYTGDVMAQTSMNQNNLYAFTDIRGQLRSLRYTLGLGASYIHYRQNNHNYDFLTFRPKATLSYAIMQGMKLSYTFEKKDRASRIAMTNEATIQVNSMEQTVGNPDLKPGRDTEHTLRLSYDNPRWSTYVQLFSRLCNRPNMALYTRTSDNQFIYTQTNQKEIDLLHTMAYASYWLLPEKVQIMAYGGMQRCFNYGDDYRHFYTSWFCAANVTAYLGQFTLQAYADNGSRWLEGETRGYSGAYTSLQASYQYRKWSFSLSWTNPLCRNYKLNEGELINCNLHRIATDYSADRGNSISLNIAWRLSRGKKHQAAEKTITLSDTDNGILR